jgi:hypothetical protein
MLTYADVCRATRRRGDAVPVRVLVLNAMLPVALAGVRFKKLRECCGTSSVQKKAVQKKVRAYWCLLVYQCHSFFLISICMFYSCTQYHSSFQYLYVLHWCVLVQNVQILMRKNEWLQVRPSSPPKLPRSEERALKEAEALQQLPLQALQQLQPQVLPPSPLTLPLSPSLAYVKDAPQSLNPPPRRAPTASRALGMEEERGERKGGAEGGKKGTGDTRLVVLFENINAHASSPSSRRLKPIPKGILNSTGAPSPLTAALRACGFVWS